MNAPISNSNGDDFILELIRAPEMIRQYPWKVYLGMCFDVTCFGRKIKFDIFSGVLNELKKEFSFSASSRDAFIGTCSKSGLDSKAASELICKCERALSRVLIS